MAHFVKIAASKKAVNPSGPERNGHIHSQKKQSMRTQPTEKNIMPDKTYLSFCEVSFFCYPILQREV